MPDDVIRLLLDEHYPSWLATELVQAGIDAQAVIARDDLRGASDTTVLRTATSEERVVVTEDVSIFSIAMAAIPTPEWSSAITPGFRGPDLAWPG